MKQWWPNRVWTMMAPCVLAMAVAVPPATVQAADFPTKAIRVVVPFAPGGATDVIARVVAQKMSDQLGQTVLVENRAGASGNLGAQAVARAAPDGYTLLMATSSHAINATLYRNPGYSLTKDFAALSNLATVPLLLVVNPQVQARNLAEFTALAKARGDAVNYASGGTGTGTAAHLAGERFNALTGTRMVHVPYKGGAPAQVDLIGGRVQAMFANLPEVQPHVESGKLRPLAVSGSARRAGLPEVPTFNEAGRPEMDMRSWFGLFAPAATPPEVVARLSDVIATAVADATVKAQLKKLGADPVGNRHEAFQPFVAAEVRRWGELVESSGATAE